MKQIKLNIPDDYADAISVTCIGSSGCTINVKPIAFSLVQVRDEAEFTIGGDGADGNT